MPDVFLRAGEANPNDVKLTDPTTTAEVTSTATFDQVAASWAATDAETFSATGAWTQAAATWAAVAAEAFAATGSFTQAAVAWSAVAAETFATTASFVQDAAAWSATDAEVLDATGAWTQAPSTWGATADSDAAQPSPPASAAVVTGVGRPYVQRPRVAVTASFAQQPASWRAEMDTYNPYALYLLTDEPVLIGASA